MKIDFSLTERVYGLWEKSTLEFLEHPEENEGISGFICFEAYDIANKYLKHCYVLLSKNSDQNILDSFDLHEIYKEINKINPEFLQGIELNDIFTLLEYYFHGRFPGYSVGTDYEDVKFCSDIVKQIRQKAKELNESF